MSFPTVGVLCVDDNSEVCKSLQRWFEQLSAFRWLGSWTSTAGVEEAVARLEPDVVLLDYDMPGSDPLGLITRLKQRFPSVRVAILTGHLRPDYIENAIGAGAVGYISKSDNPVVIAAAVQGIAEGKILLSAAAAEVIP